MHLKYRFSLAAAAVLIPLLTAYTNCSAHNTGAALDDSSSSYVSTPCTLADQSLREPATIDAVVDLINSLPKPLSLECFLKNIEKPMQVVAVDNNNSAQPSAGPDSPRIFVLRYPLVLSIVPAGNAKHLLEMSQFELSTTSVKAEVEFPITQNIANSLPYDRLIAGPGMTSCRACHSNEYKVFRGYRGEAYASDVVRPDPLKRVTVAKLQQLALNCNSAADAYRCAILKAIFIDGAAQQGSFP